MNKSIFLASNAIVTGDVTLGENANLWFHVVVRGDVAPIRIGTGVNLQDSCVVHCEYLEEQVVEDNVVAGHRAILHGKRVGMGSLIGMGAILLSGSVIGAECIIAAGTVVKQQANIPPRSLVAGVPGKIIRQVTEEDLLPIRAISERYINLANRYACGEFLMDLSQGTMRAIPWKPIVT